MSDTAAVAELARSLDIEFEGRHPDVIVNDVFEEKVEDSLTGPVFVIDYPASICPLTKRKQDQPEIAERFELFIKGMELANAYTELNDPRLQEELFRTQLEGQDEEDSMAKMDTEFIQALKVGMPPAGGLGIGIDRLVMLLTDPRRDLLPAAAARRGSGSEGLTSPLGEAATEFLLRRVSEDLCSLDGCAASYLKELP